MLELIALLLLSQQPLQPVTEGVASYYTVASSSTLTASGETMQDHIYTCAMRNGEFGGYYLVVAENGNAVVCRLNDRGPYRKRRVIDLSEAAMNKLGATTQGLIKVKIYRIDLDILPDFVKVDRQLPAA